jgi:hypothetical protein
MRDSASMRDSSIFPAARFASATPHQIEGSSRSVPELPQQWWITPTAGAGGRIDWPNLLALDTGGAGGGALSAVRIDGGQREWA